MPSDHTIGFFLQKEFDFNPKTLQAFIRDFRDSLAYAKLAPSSKIPDGNQVKEGSLPEEEFEMQPVTTVAAGTARGQGTATAIPLVPAAGFLDESYPLDGGRAFILRRPSALSAAELEEFDAWVALLQRKMKRLVQQ